VPGTPTATPTPGTGTTCQAGQTVVVTASLDKAFAGFAVTLTYPTSANIPGSGPGAGGRVVFAVSGGITTTSDEDDVGGDGVDDTLLASFAGSADQNPGAIFTVTFDCVAGMTRPSPGDFTCAASASTSIGDPIPDVGCSLGVQ
jgi:hypothetical protein